MSVGQLLSAEELENAREFAANARAALAERLADKRPMPVLEAVAVASKYAGELAGMVPELCECIERMHDHIAALTPSPDHADLIGRLEEALREDINGATLHGAVVEALWHHFSRSTATGFEHTTRVIFSRAAMLPEALAQIRSLTASLSRVEGERDEAAEALRPFAERGRAEFTTGDFRNPDPAPESQIVGSEVLLTVGDLRRAAWTHARLSRASGAEDNDA